MDSDRTTTEDLRDIMNTTLRYKILDEYADKKTLFMENCDPALAIDADIHKNLFVDVCNHEGARGKYCRVCGEKIK